MTGLDRPRRGAGESRCPGRLFIAARSALEQPTEDQLPEDIITGPIVKAEHGAGALAGRGAGGGG